MEKITIRAYFKEYNYLISGVKIYVATVMILLALIFSSYFEELKYLRNQFYIFTFTYAFFVMIIQNQINLDNIFSKRFDKASGLPEKIINLFEKTECREEKNSYYTDSIERVMPLGISKKSKNKESIPSMNKALRQAEKIKNPKEKVKYLYGFILKNMSIKGINIEKSYSTGEIYKKAEKINQLDRPFRKVTSMYDRVKYGEKIPYSSQVDDTKNNVVESIKIIKRQSRLLY
ncbi:hypothetical protein RBH29_00575 [Herbivorax sp. ANBcel31]|uniref:hypothetical protein n=1 Tax=Herbivorax sp. ANBcel31 TaxID=3069754 RepID=UPI0027B0F61C|nr:hypothetical protein [Herbivorax sp. ANBcel31]MDQ2084931.1 hypothetical protein [Herbivorax sp. ANBcel31]